MASVQELLLAAQARKSPFLSLLEGATQGFGQAQEAGGSGLERIKTLMTMQQAQQAQERNHQLIQEIARKTEQGVKMSFNGVATPGTAPDPAGRLEQSYSVDEKGNVTTNYKPKETKPGTIFNAKQAMAMGIPKDQASALEAQFPGGIPKDAIDTNISSGNRTIALGEKQSQYVQKRLTAFGDALDPSKARAGEFAKSQSVINRADGLQALGSSFQEGNLDRRQIEELAIGLNSMLSRSNTGAQEQVKQLVPNTILGNAQKTVEWLINKPLGTNQQEFVKRMMGTVEREKAVAQAQVKNVQFQRIGRYADLEKSNPDEFYNIMQSMGLDPQEYKQFRANGFKPATEGSNKNQSSIETQRAELRKKLGL